MSVRLSWAVISVLLRGNKDIISGVCRSLFPPGMAEGGNNSFSTLVRGTETRVAAGHLLQAGFVLLAGPRTAIVQEMKLFCRRSAPWLQWE